MTERRRRPGWISKNADGKDSIDRALPEIAVQTALYGAKFPSRVGKDSKGKVIDPACDPCGHLYQLVTAQFFRDARTMTDWHCYADEYPKVGISADETIQQSNPNVAARAYYLREALSKLLELAKAPNGMAADLNALLGPLTPEGAEVRAKVQKAILDDPNASLNDIASRTKSAPGQISKDGKAGLLVWPADSVDELQPDNE
jgi:hypothetical protein